MSIAGYKNAKYPPLRGNREKGHKTSLRLCNIKLDYTSRLMGIRHLRRDMLIFSVPFQKHRLRQAEKKETKIQMLRATCSADFHRYRPNSNDTKDTGVPAGSRRKTYRDQEKRVFSSKLPPTYDVRCTQARRENNVQQRRRKTRST